MTPAERITILQFERQFHKIHSDLPGFDSGFELVDFKSKKPVKFDNMFISDALQLDFDELYDNPEVLANCQILSDELKTHADFQWWNLGDSLVQVVYDFVTSDTEITNCGVALLQSDLVRMYLKYEQLVASELPPKIPGDCNE